VLSLTDEVRAKLNSDFIEKLKTLSLTIWEGKANGPQISGWLSNFKGDVLDVETERTYMLYLLTRFMYYGQREIRALLRSIYFDLFRYPLIASIRRRNNNTTDTGLIDAEFLKQLQATRFLGLGGVAKSGTMLLYPFRKATGLSEASFVTADAVFAGNAEATPPLVKRLVFIDDICGTGEQAKDYDAEIVAPIRAKFGKSIELSYFVMFATTGALSALRPPSTGFDRVEAVHELDASFKCFDANSRYLPTKELERASAHRVASTYGLRLSAHPLGFRGTELLLGFSHNVPDNTLPIMWSTDSQWKPIFERF